MKTKRRGIQAVVWIIILMVAMPPWIFAQESTGPAKFKQEELDQMLAPIALYPDSLLGQILIASTYPLEIVQADRWAKAQQEPQGRPSDHSPGEAKLGPKCEVPGQLPPGVVDDE